MSGPGGDVLRERWLVVWNCQSFGLANCIQTLARDIECEALDIWSFGKALETESPQHWRAWDRIITMGEATALPGFKAADMPPFEILPPLYFSGYHPDCCYVLLDGEPVSGAVVGPYHSMIALAAYKEGMTAREASRWYNATTYGHAGYFAHWPMQRQLMLDSYRERGIDLSRLFRVVGRGACFMHTIDHPRIPALFEVARALLVARGKAVFENVVPPPDNLSATSWPVYPEIGERLAVAGSYLFKPANLHKPFELVEYLERSLAFFSQWEKQRLRVFLHLQPQLQTIRKLMRGEIA